jgi:3-deoxy-D-manno-octulosonic-acid transferase
MTPQRSASARRARPEQRRYAVEAYRSLPVTFVRRVVLGRNPYWRRYFWSRWGFLPRDVPRALRRRPTVVLNALSGEVTQLVGFCRALRAALPDHALLFITNNRYSYDFGVANLAVDAVLDSPWDCRGPVRRFLRAISPVALVAVETMTSPVLFEEGRRRGAVTLVISGLMSGNFDRHPMQARSVEAGAFAPLDGVGAKSEDDARAFELVGSRPDRTVVTGNLRFDLEYLHVSDSERNALRSTLQLENGEPVLLAASVHPGEERLAGEAYVEARRSIAGLRMILVPRYAFHVADMIAELNVLGLQCVRRTTLPQARAGRDDVIVVDTFGELNRLYALASVVFLGGTTYLRNVVGAGQNPIEPLVQRRPFFFGTHMALWRHVTGRLKAVWPALEVTTAKELASGILALFEDRAPAARLIETIDAIVSEHREDVARNVDFVVRALDNAAPPASR